MAAILAVIFVCGLIIIRQVGIYKEKQRFEQARQSIEKLYGVIEAKGPKPDDVEHKQSCSYTSQEFGQGARSCGVATTAVYRSKNDVEANRIMGEIDNLSDSTQYLTKEKRYGSLATIPFSDSDEINGRNTQGYSDISSRMGCFISYSREAPTSSRFKTENGNDLYVRIVCSAPAKAQYYPVSN